MMALTAAKSILVLLASHSAAFWTSLTITQHMQYASIAFI
jgi:hypothetical protein